MCGRCGPQEWLRYEQELMRRGAESLSHNVLQETAPPQLTQTTAEPRPNAYIPGEHSVVHLGTSYCSSRRIVVLLSAPALADDVIGIPKPYGVLAPFKPTEAGTTMRHIRKPQPREIEL